MPMIDGINVESYADLSGVDLSGTDLSGLQLIETNFTGANLSGADLTGTNLGGANLSEANLTNANLSNSNINYSKLKNANFTDANLSNSYINNVDFADVIFIGANFSGIDFSYNEELTNLNASGANFSGANLNHAVFTGSNLSGATISNQFRNANFSNTDLSGASIHFSETGSRGSNFSGADLSNVHLGGASMYSLNFQGANLSGANLSNVDARTTLFQYSNLTNADLSSANLWAAWLQNADLTGANLSNSNLSGISGENAIFVNTDLSDAIFFDPIMNSKAILNGATFYGSNYTENSSLSPELLEDAYLDISEDVIPFQYSELATIISLTSNDVPYVSEGIYHLYHDGWSKNLTNFQLGPPTETSSIYLQEVELDTSNDYTVSSMLINKNDYKATDTSPIQLTGEQITSLKQANGSQIENNLLVKDFGEQKWDNIDINHDTVPEVMREPTVTFTASIDKWGGSGSSWLNGPLIKLHSKINDIVSEVGIDLSMKDGHPGHKHKPGMDKESYELRVEHEQDTDGAINIDDVMGVLSLSRGLTQTTSDEHKLAADWNGDGLINIDDVMGVLSRSRGMVRDDEWRFYDKSSNTSLWDKNTKTNKMDIILEDNKDIELSAILRGDVNASYNADDHDRVASSASAPTPNPAPLPLNNDDELLTINPDIV